MSPVRPLLLPDTATAAGFDHVDPLSQWFLGGSTAAGATATGISDDDRYGLDVANSGSGGKALRATSGNGTYGVRVDNTGAFAVGGWQISGPLSVSGTAVFTGLVTMQAGLTVSTGTTTLGGAVTMANGLTVTTGASTFGGSVTMASTLLVSGTATALRFISTVTTGTAPFGVSSTTEVPNLNAQYLGGNTAGAFAVAAHTHGYLSLAGGTLSGGLNIATGGIVVAGGAVLDGAAQIAPNGGSTLAFFGATPQTLLTVSGARNNPEAALRDLLGQLENYGLINDTTTAS